MTEPRWDTVALPARMQKAGLFIAFAGMGGTASIIPAIIPLAAHNSNSQVSAYLGAVPALFFGLMTGVLLSSLLLRAIPAAATLSAGSLLQAAALIAIAAAPDGAAFAISAAAAGLGFGLCEASGSILARVLAGEGTTGLLSALTGTVALVAGLGPLLIVAGLLGENALPWLTAVALGHITTAGLFLFAPTARNRPRMAAAPSAASGTSPAALFFLLAPVSAALFLYVGVETVFAGWSAVIPAEALTLDATTAAAGTSAFWVLMAAGRYAAWFILKSTATPSAVLATTCTVAVTCFAVAGVLRQAHPGAALVTTGVALACLGPMYSLILGIGLTRVKVQDAKKAVGLLVAFGAAGGACVPAALLSFTPRPGSAGVFLAAAALTAAIVPLIVRLRRPQKISLPHTKEPENTMAVLHDIEESLASKEPTAPPSWTNAHLALVNENVVLHSGAGVLQGAWHSQDSDEILLVLSGRCTVETGEGALTAGAGQLIRISAHEPHRVSTGEETVLVAIEGSAALRTPLSGPGA